MISDAEHNIELQNESDISHDACFHAKVANMSWSRWSSFVSCMVTWASDDLRLSYLFMSMVTMPTN